MAADEQEMKSFWNRLFSKEDAFEEAQSYGNLAFFKKSKNVLVTCIVAILVLSIGLSLYTAILKTLYLRTLL